MLNTWRVCVILIHFPCGYCVSESSFLMHASRELFDWPVACTIARYPSFHMHSSVSTVKKLGTDLIHQQTR